MKVLAVNCGSSALKFRLSETPSVPSGREERLAWGAMAGVGGRGALDLYARSGAARRESAEVADYGEAVGRVFGWLGEVGALGAIEAVGHRVVDVEDRFARPMLVDDEVVNTTARPRRRGYALCSTRRGWS